MFLGWSFLGTFKLASAGPFVASRLAADGFSFGFGCFPREALELEARAFAFPPVFEEVA